MTECDEVAASLMPRYTDWLNIRKRSNNVTSLRQFVDERMPDESHTVRDNVVYSIMSFVGIVGVVQKPNSPGDSPLAGSW